jgi:hypothetical protein
MAPAAYEVRFTRALPARHLPSSGFDHPLDGLLPREPRRPCFMPTAPLGFSLRSLLLPRGRTGVSAVACPACRYRRPDARDRRSVTGPDQQTGYRVRPPESPLLCGRVSSPTHRRLLPWAFSLSGDLRIGLGGHFNPPPPSRFCATPGYPCIAPHAPRSFDQPTLSLTQWAKHPSEGFRASTSLAFGRCAGPGYVFTSQGAVRYHPASRLLFGPSRAYLSCQGC